MESVLKALRIQHLNATDKITAALRDLKIDRLEFRVYDYMLSGEVEAHDDHIDAIDLFLRACENLTKHLESLERAFLDTRRIYKEIIDLLEKKASST